MRSLRRLSAVTFLCAALLLGALVLTGIRQNILTSDYSTIVKESESTIFLYATIQEQATEGLLSRDPSHLLGAAKEFEQLQSRYVAMLDSRLIPSQYKLSFLQDLDLGRVVINLRNLAENPTNEDLILSIIGQLRQMNKQFLQFDRIVVNDMRNRVMQYQKRALVLMGMIIFLTCVSLIILYLKSVKPLIDLGTQAEQALLDGNPLKYEKEKKSSVEVRSLITSFNQLLQKTKEESPDDLTHNRREAEFSAIINEATNRLNGIINYSQLLADYCEAEQVGGEQKQILYKIIQDGEKCAAILRKGLQ
jgi:methyl-accepting chemotaxis protein